MKIKSYSWIVGSAYLFCGGLGLFVIPKLQVILVKFGLPLPPFTRAVFVPGPLGWLLLLAAMGALAVFKDLRFRSRLWNPVFAIVLVLLLCGIFYALLLPVIPGPISESNELGGD